MNYAPVTRILLRYLAGLGVSYGMFAQDGAEYWATNPDVVLLVSAGIGAAVEVSYTFAKRKGWAT